MFDGEHIPPGFEPGGERGSMRPQTTPAAGWSLRRWFVTMLVVAAVVAALVVLGWRRGRVVPRRPPVLADDVTEVG